jgi:hypothetical protein
MERDCPRTSNEAERELRPSVSSRQVSGGNRTVFGATVQACLMSLIRTAKRQGLDPVG